MIVMENVKRARTRFAFQVTVTSFLSVPDSTILGEMVSFQLYVH